MTTKSALILAEVPNSGIVQLPGRRFPGVVIQGDSLSSMFTNLAFALERAKAQRDEEAYYAIFMVADRMQDLLSAYEQLLTAKGTPLPWRPLRERLIHDDFVA